MKEEHRNAERLPQLLNLKQVCKKLGMSADKQNVDMVRRLIHKHEVRYYKLGRSIAISTGALHFLLKQMESCSSSLKEVNPRIGKSKAQSISDLEKQLQSVSLADALTDAVQKFKHNG